MCYETQCCQKHSTPKKGYENVTAGNFGATQCHLPQVAIESALEFVSTYVGNNEDGEEDSFVLWTMDSTGSKMFQQTVRITLDTITAAVEMFQDQLANKRQICKYFKS